MTDLIYDDRYLEWLKAADAEAARGAYESQWTTPADGLAEMKRLDAEAQTMFPTNRGEQRDWIRDGMRAWERQKRREAERGEG